MHQVPYEAVHHDPAFLERPVFDYSEMSRRWFLGTLGVTALRPGRLLQWPTRGGAGARPALAAEVRLHANENGWGSAPAIQERLGVLLGSTNRYGLDGVLPTEADLRRRIGVYTGLSEESVVLAHGSTELLALAAGQWSDRGVLTFVPTYPTILRYANLRRSPLAFLRPEAGVEVDPMRLVAEAGTTKAGMLYLCNPNNPTGQVLSIEVIETVLDRVPADTMVVVDEAYHEYAEGTGKYQSAGSLVRTRTNLVVLRTFSKMHGLAGLRLGYGLAQPAIAEQLSGLQAAPHNPLSIAAGLLALDAEAFIHECRRRVAEGQLRLARQLDSLGIPHAGGPTNFRLFQPGDRESKILQALDRRAVRIAPPLWPGWHRITIGNEAEMQVLSEALASTD